MGKNHGHSSVSAVVELHVDFVISDDSEALTSTGSDRDRAFWEKTPLGWLVDDSLQKPSHS